MIINSVVYSQWSYLPYWGSSTTDDAYGKLPDDFGGSRIKSHGHSHLLGLRMGILKILIFECDPDTKVYNPASNHQIK